MTMAVAANRNSRRRVITMAAISPPLSPLLAGGSLFPTMVIVCDGCRCGVVWVRSGSLGGMLVTVMAGEGICAVGTGEIVAMG